MAFADFYFDYYSSLPEQIIEAPHPELGMVVVIPCINEPNILLTLKNLVECDRPSCPVEIFVIINSSTVSNELVIRNNEHTFSELTDWSAVNSSPDFRIIPLLFKDLPRKHAGAGLARKIGMDEAIRRFNDINNSRGIIVSLDADTLVEKNYLTEIYNAFLDENLKTAVIHYEHPIEGEDFDSQTYHYITLYELHLRYMRQASAYTGFPYSYHTVGSAFAVCAEIYVKQGGMNKRTAGEDFYFLNKLFPQGGVRELNSTKIIPSPRASDRVPFGTGASMTTLLREQQSAMLTYSFESYVYLKQLFDSLGILYKTDPELNTIIENETFITFLKQDNFADAISTIKKNVTSFENFTRRFYNYFDAFKIVKYLNYIHEHDLVRQNVLHECKKLFDYLHLEIPTEYNNGKDLLQLLRDVDTQHYKR